MEIKVLESEVKTGVAANEMFVLLSSIKGNRYENLKYNMDVY